MTDREAFHIAVLSDPDNDGPRLVYADYLDEQGNDSDAARAELIRVQVELSRWEPPNPFGHDAGGLESALGRGDYLRTREQQLLRDWSDRWRRPPCPECGGRRVIEKAHATHRCPTCDGKGSTHPLGEGGRRIPNGGVVQSDWKHAVRWERGFAVVTCDLGELGQAVYSETIRVGDTSRYDQVWQPSPWALDCVRHGVSFDTGNAEQNRTRLKLTLNAVMEGAKV